MKLFDETGTVCSIQGFHVNTTKKQQRSEQLRKTYTEEMSVYDPEMLVFVDRHAALRCYMVTHYKGKKNAMCMDSVLG